MRMVFTLVLLLGVALAGFAVYMAQNYIATTQHERDALLEAQKNAPRLVDVVVARRPLKYGERMSRDDLEVIKWQADRLPEGTFTTISAPIGSPEGVRPVFFDGETRPRAALRSLETYEPVLKAKITEPGVDAGINANLTAGMRAFTIKVDVSSGVSGFLRPDDRVDVYWSGNINGNDVTKLIRPAIRLIAIDQNADADRAEATLVARTVTVEATPESVAALALAQSTGALSLSLVGTGDTATTETVEIDQNKLLGIKPEEVVEAIEERVCTIRTNKGGEVLETQIPCTN